MGSNGKIVIVDDDQEMRSLLDDFLKGKDFEVIPYCNGDSLLLAINNSNLNVEEIDVIITDLRMPGLTGLELIEKLKEKFPKVPVILITAFGSVESAIEAVKKGAYDYIVKPFKLREINITIDRAIEFRRLQRENSVLSNEIRRNWHLDNIVGKSRGMQQVLDLVKRVSKSMANILVTGESGTGKEVIARAIHQNGPRQMKPFIAVNCASIPDTLLESELFGHAKGAFTGAVYKKRGLFEEANGGTIFLDEIGDLDLALQAKLLRVIQERKIKAIGENIEKSIDVRIICATHKDLKEAIRKGQFREDLYYRLSVIPIVIPPLRHRKEDIPVLADYFLRKYSAANNSSVKGFTKAAMAKLIQYNWEGNVRELENIIERSIVLSNNQFIDVEDLPSPESENAELFYGHSIEDYPSLEQLEKRYIQWILDKTGGRKEKASYILGINRRTLYRKEREYGLIPLHETIPADENLPAGQTH